LIIDRFISNFLALKEKKSTKTSKGVRIMSMEKALVSQEYNVKITPHQDLTSYRKLVFHFYFISFFLLFLGSTFSCLVISFQGATIFFCFKL